MSIQDALTPAGLLEYVVRLSGVPGLSFEPLVVSPAKGYELLAEAFGVEPAELQAIRDGLRARVAAAADALLAEAGFVDKLRAVPAREGGTVVVVGDSTSADLLSCAYLLGALLERTRPDLNFVNRAVSGRTTAETIATAAGLIAAQPDTVFLLVGANDARRHGALANVRMASLEETTRNFAELKRLIELETHAQIVAVAPAPFDPSVGEAQREQGMWFLPDDLAEIVRAFCGVFPEAIRLDSAADGLAAQFWSFDGVHPSLDGHTAILRTVVDALASA
jgi:lysophospholipase L1-like esterase